MVKIYNRWQFRKYLVLYLCPSSCITESMSWLTAPTAVRREGRAWPGRREVWPASSSALPAAKGAQRGPHAGPRPARYGLAAMAERRPALLAAVTGRAGSRGQAVARPRDEGSGSWEVRPRPSRPENTEKRKLAMVVRRS